MAVTNFIRTIWDAELKQALSKKLVSQYFVNHNYEGAIMGAGSVKINQLADVTLRDYDGNDITTEDIATTAVTMIAVTTSGTLNNIFVDLDMAFTCANVPIPKHATHTPKKAKIFPSHFTPKPFSI